MSRICIVPRVEGLAGVASFRLKFEEGLRARGIEVIHNPSTASDAILVLGGTRNLLPLWMAHRRGRRIVQRLDGINWVHKKRNTGPKHYLRAEYGNFLLSFIRSHIASGIIYQSEFSRRWWNDWYGETRVLSHVILNSVDLNTYSVGQSPALAPGRFAPLGSRPGRGASVTNLSYPPYRLLVVEGNLGGGYEMGLDNAIELAETLKEKHSLPVELTVVGKITDEQRARVSTRARIPIQWLGSLPRERIPQIMRSAHLFFSSDLHPACPNSVIEALACGLPVLAFDTGALKELVIGDSGRIVPYGSDPWKIEKPDIPALAEAALEILSDLPRFRTVARLQAESSLGMDKMVDEYLKVLLGHSPQSH